ncbi:MAG TPA: AgmX/PglI C-terminal domain-containing protein, partial [Polyangiaceae bacterium]|nr:AgmX/PglI C-terminal domain-containing protein [Polyangiaceae bacterium]
EELTFALDLGAARATVVRAGMAGVRRGNEIRVRAQDLVPRSDLSVELFDGGVDGVVGYRADHALALDTLPRSEREAARDAVAKEPDYLVVPVRATDVPLAEGGLDLAIVIDASAATDAGSLALARATTGALLAHLGADDRAAVWAGADALRPVTPRSGKLTAVDPALRAEVGAALARVAPGGATDLGKMLGDAAVALDPARRGAVVYVGDGRPTVGELGLDGLRQRLAKLARPVRVYALAVGVGADLGILGGLARGGFAARVEDGFGAARQALELLEHAERPVWLGASVDLGPTVERVYPRDTSTWVADESVLVVGRLSGREPPKRVALGGPAGRREVELTVRPLADHGDAARRWGLGRLAELLDEGAGHAAMVDLGSRQGLITPVTSLYVPTTRELASDYDWADQPTAREEEQRSSRPGLFGRLLLRRKAAASAPMVAASAATAPAPTMAAAADDREGGGATRAKGEEGWRGRADEEAKPAAAPPAAPRLARAAAPPAEGADPQASRAVALREAQEPAAGGVAKSRDAAPWGRDASLGQDSGDLAAPGGGGLGLTGIGAGGGGEGLAQGGALKVASTTGTGAGFGSGHGRLGASHATRVPVVRMGAASIEGGLPPEVVQRVVRQSYGRYRICYEQGLARNPNLTGRVAVRFVIGPDGAVETASTDGSDLPDAEVVGCVATSFRGLDFPSPEYGRVTVVYPILFAPDGGAVGTAAAEAVAPTLLVRVLPRVPILCGDAARVSLEERVALWLERLAQVRDQAPAVAAVYSRALRQCEASTPRERARLLALMLDAMSTVRGKVELWRMMRDQLGAADLLYRGILARAKTAAQIRELHDALGLRSVDPGVLAKTLADAKEPRQRIARLRALRLLDALEDADDGAGARALAGELRARPDAEAGVRTAVGELYLRLAGRAAVAGERAAAIAEARRAFGEIVEFSPADPVARRRLGDLLRAHGWHAEARRQYETLAQLTPDDTAVALLIAAAAQGEGRLEEAVRWTEKGIDAGAPDVAQGPAVTARTFATTFLAWGRLDAAAREKEREALAARARRLVKEPATKAARVTLTFTHPDFHPTLWSNALGAPMPAATGDLTLGIAEAVVPLRDDAAVEVRVDPAELEAAGRLGVEAVLTVVFAELDRRERIVRVPIRYGPGSPAVQRFVLRGQEVVRG